MTASAQPSALQPCLDVFKIGLDGFSELRGSIVGEDLITQVEAAVAGCPVGAISVRKA